MAGTWQSARGVADCVGSTGPPSPAALPVVLRARLGLPAAYRCDTCPKRGYEVVRWEAGRRIYRCAAYGHTPDGACWFQVHGDQPPDLTTEEGIYAALRDYVQIATQELKLEVETNRATGTHDRRLIERIQRMGPFLLAIANAAHRFRKVRKEEQDEAMGEAELIDECIAFLTSHREGRQRLVRAVQRLMPGALPAAPAGAAPHAPAAPNAVADDPPPATH